jgi:hypothetical protein
MPFFAPRIRASRGALRFAAAALLLVTAAPSDAADRPVAIGEVAAHVAGREADLVPAMRASIERELSGLDFSRAPRGKRWVLSASLVRLEAETVGGVTRASCVVSAVVREAKGGAIRAVLEGRAKAENDPDHRAQAELGALSAAVHGAIVAVPNVL